MMELTTVRAQKRACTYGIPVAIGLRAIGALQHTLVRPPAALYLIFLRPYTILFHHQPTAYLLHIFVERHLWIVVSTTPRYRDVCNDGIIALSRTYPFVFSLPPTMFLEFILEFLHGICFVRMNGLRFSALGLILLFS